LCLGPPPGLAGTIGKGLPQSFAPEIWPPPLQPKGAPDEQLKAAAFAIFAAMQLGAVLETPGKHG